MRKTPEVQKKEDSWNIWILERLSELSSGFKIRHYYTKSTFLRQVFTILDT